MTRCPECSKENNEDASFCQYCGTNIARPEKEGLIHSDGGYVELDLDRNIEVNRSIRDLIISILVIVDTVLMGVILLYPSYSNSAYIIGFDLIVCIILFIEFVYNKHSEDYESSLNEDIIDIFAMIPLLFFMILPAAWTNYLAFVRLFKIVILLEKGKKHIFNFFQKTNFSYLLITLFIIICAGSIAVLVIEKSAHGDINSPLDAVWYVIATVSTVGYGDVTPESVGGKIIGIFLMIVGAGFFSLLTAYLASWFMEEVEEEENEIKNKIISMEKSVGEMKSEIKELKELLKGK
ncbi:MAG TPA: ion channel [Methanobacterium sp.]|nr:ion channel [Methanobacterium sp.]